MTSENKRPVGRPPTKTMLPRIDASPEEIARVLMTTKPPKEWPYKKAGAESEDASI